LNGSRLPIFEPVNQNWPAMLQTVELSSNEGLKCKISQKLLVGSANYTHQTDQSSILHHVSKFFGDAVIIY
jgi:hypothetical protein